MKLAELHQLSTTKRNPGWRVHFERPERGGWASDMVPDRDEAPMDSEEAAWKLAVEVTVACPNVVNIYVIRADNFTPVSGYRERMIRPGYGRT